VALFFSHISACVFRVFLRLCAGLFLYRFFVIFVVCICFGQISAGVLNIRHQQSYLLSDSSSLGTEIKWNTPATIHLDHFSQSAGLSVLWAHCSYQLWPNSWPPTVVNINK